MGSLGIEMNAEEKLERLSKAAREARTEILVGTTLFQAWEKQRQFRRAEQILTEALEEITNKERSEHDEGKALPLQ